MLPSSTNSFRLSGDSIQSTDRTDEMPKGWRQAQTSLGSFWRQCHRDENGRIDLTEFQRALNEDEEARLTLGIASAHAIEAFWLKVAGTEDGTISFRNLFHGWVNRWVIPKNRRSSCFSLTGSRMSSQISTVDFTPSSLNTGDTRPGPCSADESLKICNESLCMQGDESSHSRQCNEDPQQCDSEHRDDSSCSEASVLDEPRPETYESHPDIVAENASKLAIVETSIWCDKIQAVMGLAAMHALWAHGPCVRGHTWPAMNLSASRFSRSLLSRFMLWFHCFKRQMASKRILQEEYGTCWRQHSVQALAEFLKECKDAEQYAPGSSISQRGLCVDDLLLLAYGRVLLDIPQDLAPWKDSEVAVALEELEPILTNIDQEILRAEMEGELGCNPPRIDEDALCECTQKKQLGSNACSSTEFFFTGIVVVSVTAIAAWTFMRGRR